MEANYGGDVKYGYAGIGFSCENGNNTPLSVIKLTDGHVGAAFLAGTDNQPYWTLDNNGFRAAISGNSSYLTIKSGNIMLGYSNKAQGPYIELTTNSIDLGCANKSSLKISSDGKTTI
jgi:hypothetical protein